jgi:hypothetical protein
MNALVALISKVARQSATDVACSGLRKTLPTA